MGLPLYIAPVESDLRNKNSSPRNSPTHGASRIRRMRQRRSTEALRESRRRAILTAAAANANPVASGVQQPHQEQLNQLRNLMYEREERERDRQRDRERDWDRARLVRAREASLSSVSNPARERLLQRFLERIRDNEQDPTSRLRVRGGGNGDSNSANNTNSANGTNTGSSGSSSHITSNAISHVADGATSSSNNANGARDGRHSWRDSLLTTLMSSSGGPNTAAGASAPTGQLPPIPNNNGATTAVGDVAAGADDYADNYVESAANRDEFNSHVLAVLNHEWAEPPVHVYRHSTAYIPSPDGASEQRPRTTMEQFLEFDETDGDVDTEANRVASRRAYRRASSLRRVTNASGSSRRPTVGWSDNNNDSAVSRSRDSSQSRIFGDVNHIPNRGGTSSPGTNDRSTPAARSSRRHGWTVRYLDANGNQHMPSVHDRFGNPIDGLGDRRRSLSPEGDGVWDTLLTTLTPDPQPPSVGSSFASSSSALAAATSQGRASLTSSQPTVTQTPVVSALPAVPSPVTRGQEEDEDGDEDDSTPAPILVGVSHSPSAYAAEFATLADGVPSGTTSAGTSQRIPSPFTVVSADADTADESVVLFDGTTGEVEDDAVCEDSEMDDGQRDGMDGDNEIDEEDEDEEEQAEFLGLLSAGPSALNGRSRLPPGQETSMHMQRMFHFEDHERPMRTGFGGIHSEGNQLGSRSRDSNNSNSNSNTEETLDFLGIGGMQHIVRSLARREDIPDEWWAEAGLSRTLPREASN